MNDTYIVTVYGIIDDLLKADAFQEDSRARSSAAEILTVAVLAAKYFQNHHERAVCLLIRLGYIRTSITHIHRMETNHHV